ncbi:hypothetical protein Pst134EA_015248 [Puccinia striiformis f. sp. tritici]|uniref:hypothetical protein n=1 Tax=Puccinia striiformis f. sp. tritici TaxID=168172 RepID=UPI00200726B3|nr:hypothetical protein Pst134EA_015248 [Puccinia striiformis f. sp. tritici]KAH9463165.1 hypothetical protein Pst134EA_015248 [Puccinia striiformis f. sp. tritici]
MSEVSLVLSSSWARRTLREKIKFETFSSHVSHISLNRDHNNHMIVAEFDIGKIRGQMPVDNLLIMHMLSKGKSSGKSKAKTAPPSTAQGSNTPWDHRRKEVPKFIFGLSIQSMSYEFYGPTCPPTTSLSALAPAATLHPIHTHTNSSRIANVLSIGCSSFHFNLTGEYVNLVIKRSKVARRTVRNRARKNEVYVPASLRGSKVDSFREKSLVDFFYWLSFTWQTHSIDLVFQDDNFNVKNVEVTSDFCFAGRNFSFFDKNPVPTIDLTLWEGTVQTLVEEVSFDLRRPHVLASLVAFTQTFTNFRQKSHDTRAKDKIEPPSTREVPIPRDIAFSIAASKFRLRAAGFDPQHDSTIARGTQLVVSNAPIECFRRPSAQPGLHCSPHRSCLDLQEDIRVQANTQLVHNPAFGICILKCAM